MPYTYTWRKSHLGKLTISKSNNAMIIWQKKKKKKKKKKKYKNAFSLIDFNGSYLVIK